MPTLLNIHTSETQPFILLPTCINGKGPFSFVLDTGAGVSIVREGLGRTLELQNLEVKDALGAGDARISVQLGYANSMSVGGVTVENTRVAIVKSLPKCIGQGVIGYDFLKRCVVTLDYPHNTLTLMAGGEYDDHKPQSALPLKLARPDRPIILLEALVNARRSYQFILDTGASQTVVSTALAEQMDAESSRGDMIVGAAGVAISSSGILKSLRIQDALLKDVSVIVSDVFSPINQAVGTNIDGILGYNILRKFRIIIDYPHGIIQFR
jgi:predicted aspartyl protease